MNLELTHLWEQAMLYLLVIRTVAAAVAASLESNQISLAE